MSNYRIVLRGIKPGQSVAQVADALARYSKKSPDKLRALLGSGKYMVAKRTTVAQQATQYKLLLERLGCDCVIEAEITRPEDSTHTTSVLVTDIADDANATPRRGINYVQPTRLQEVRERLAPMLWPGVLVGVGVLLVVFYLHWEQIL